MCNRGKEWDFEEHRHDKPNSKMKKTELEKLEEALKLAKENELTAIYGRRYEHGNPYFYLFSTETLEKAKQQAEQRGVDKTIPKVMEIVKSASTISYSENPPHHKQFTFVENNLLLTRELEKLKSKHREGKNGRT